MTHHSDKYRDNALLNESTITDGIIRWNSNGAVPPRECIDRAVALGLPIDPVACTAARDAELKVFLADYRKRMANHVHSAEELAEMRNAFGEGATVVNVITGKHTKL